MERKIAIQKEHDLFIAQPHIKVVEVIMAISLTQKVMVRVITLVYEEGLD